ncbi:cell division protein FtsH, partial [Streptomyces parvus]
PDQRGKAEATTTLPRRTPSTRPPVLSPKELALTNGSANGSATPPEIAPTADLTKDIAPSTEAIPEDRPENNS